MRRPGTGHERGSRSADYRRGEPAALHAVHLGSGQARERHVVQDHSAVDGIGDDLNSISATGDLGAVDDEHIVEGTHAEVVVVPPAEYENSTSTVKALTP